MADDLKIELIEPIDLVIPIWARSIADLGAQPRKMTLEEFRAEYGPYLSANKPLPPKSIS